MKPYALLAEAMERSQKVGIARFVMRSKQYLAAVRPKDGKLLLSTMVYADEVNDAGGIHELEGLDSIDVNERELAMAEQLIESLSAEFQPTSSRTRIAIACSSSSSARPRARRRSSPRRSRSARTRSSTSWRPSRPA